MNGGDDFHVKLIGPGGQETLADLQDKEDGTYLVTYCVTAAGAHDVHVGLGETASASDIEVQQYLGAAVLLYTVKLILCSASHAQQLTSFWLASKTGHV